MSRTPITAPVLVLVLVLGCSGDARERPAMDRGLIVLGVDGMDPELADRLMREGRMPNLQALAARGGFVRLDTANPPQSPVAWSTFITGQDPGGHGIYDFVHRDPRGLAPYLSTSKATEPESILCLIPTSDAEVELLREGRAFWQDLEDAGVPATVVKIPANFPPVETRIVESLSGMGTPDLLGTPGTFQYFTDDPAWAKRRPAGGLVGTLDFRGGQKARSVLRGPTVGLCEPKSELELPLEVVVDARSPVALVRVGDAEVILEEGEWSGWVPIGYDAGLLSGRVPGMVRFYLGEVRPHLRLYASPVNLDPRDPAMPLSSPPEYARDLARDAGRFYTQEMPEDTKALAAGALDYDEFLAQAELVYQETLRLLDRELARFQGGLLFFYFSSIDQMSHIFYGALDPRAPEELRAYAHVIPDLYQRVDAAIGEVLERAASGGRAVDVVVMSDHGFSTYRRKVHLNSWLAEEGYLTLRDTPGPGPLGHIDWDNTQAYALGLNQLFVNLRGREAHGVVAPEDVEPLLRRLERELLTFRDPADNARVVTRVERPPVGRFGDRAPDLLVGYNRGYRSSDESAMGEIVETVIEDNLARWSGDHCMDPAHVPGVLFTSFEPAAGRASLADLAPTILAYFGLSPPGEMQGAILWDAARSRSRSP